MDRDTVAQALEFIDKVLAKVACSREDHHRLAKAIGIVSDAAFGPLEDEK